MKLRIALLACAVTLSAPVLAKEMTKMVGGAAIYPSRTTVDNPVFSKDHTTLGAAVIPIVDTVLLPG